jgi:hypothetical protein
MDVSSFNSITRTSLLKIELDKDKIKIPLNKIVYCFVSYAILFMIVFLKGSEHTKSIVNVKNCSFSYWAIFISYLPLSLIITFIVGRNIYEEYIYRREIGFPYSQEDIKWTDKIIIKFPLYAFSAGILSGLLGIGGGLILGPLFLDFGIHPLVKNFK